MKDRLAQLKADAKRAGWAGWIRSEQDERAVLDGCVFVEEIGRRVVEFFPRFLRHWEGQWAGKPFELMEWQRDELIMPLFSWIRPDGTRRFRRASWWVSKKNGKTGLCSGLACYGVMGDGEAGALVVSAAVTREQASYVYENARQYITASPALRAHFVMVDSKKRLVYPRTKGRYQALSADGNANEGLNASMLIEDEKHAWTGPKGRRLHGSLKFAGAARRQPLRITISTAGEDTDSLGHEEYERAKRVLSGDLADTELLPYVAEAEKGDDITDPDVWRKANPALGEIISLDSFGSDVQEALDDPNTENDFLRYRLNQWVTAKVQWIRPEEWEACGLTIDDCRLTIGGGEDHQSSIVNHQWPTDREELLELLAQYPCAAGLDLAEVDDSTAWVLAFRIDHAEVQRRGGEDQSSIVNSQSSIPDPQSEEPCYALVGRCFLPEEGIVRKGQQDDVNYRLWARDGFYTLTPGNVTDLEFVKQEIIADGERFDLRSIAFDPWKARLLANEMVNEHGMPMVEFRQGYASMSEPCKFFLRLVKSRRLIHFGDPVGRWMAGNAVTTSDPAGNVKLDKRASKKKIDWIVAAVMAVARAREIDAARSSYEDGGIFTIGD